MKKISGSFVAVLILAAILTVLGGCNRNDSSDALKLDEIKSKAEQKTTGQGESKSEEKKNKKKERSKETEETEQETEGFTEGYVENNGGLFVKAGNRVYFRIYDQRALALTTIGKPFVSEVAQNSSRLMCYDLDSDTASCLCDVHGMGGLFATTEGLLLRDFEHHSTTLITYDGKVTEGYHDGYVIEVTSDGTGVTYGEVEDFPDEIGHDDDDDGSHVAGEVYLSEGGYADLMCHTYEGEDIVLYKEYIDRALDDAMFADDIDGGVCFSNECAFVIRTMGYRSPEEGKWAYDLSKLTYECFRYDKEHLKDGRPQYRMLAEQSSPGWSKGHIDYEELVGTWEMKGAIVEGFQYDDYSEASIAALLTFNEDGSAVISHKDKNTGKRTGTDTKLHRAEGDEYTPDYAFYYEDDEDNPMSVGVCYLSDGRLGIYCLYHYDGTSTGWYRGSYYKTEG